MKIFLSILFFLLSFELLKAENNLIFYLDSAYKNNPKLNAERESFKATKENLNISNFPKALKFMRKISDQDQNIYHHLGVYCYKLETLKKFVSYDQSSNEIKERLEQMRALDNNIKINVALAKSSTIGIDTEEDFVAIKKIMEYKS